MTIFFFLRQQWIQVPSVGSRMRQYRNLIFTSVKRTFFDSLVDSTTTATQLSHDEYELPREIRTVRVNRLRARRASGKHSKQKFSVFSQLYHEMKSWSGAALRRGFVAKGHGGQKRAFKVKLVGEGVNDYSGPYREIFTDAIREVAEVDSEDGVAGAGTTGVLGVLEPTPNQATDVGDDRDLFLFASSSGGVVSNGAGATTATTLQRFPKEERDILMRFASVIRSGDEASRDTEERLTFLGRLTSTAVRHGIALDINLPLNIVWKKMVEEPFSEQTALEEVSLLTTRIDNEEEKKAHVHELFSSQQRLLNSFVDGMCGVLPVEMFALFSGKELRNIVCGNAEIDVDLLRKVATYENYNEQDLSIEYFWSVLREMTSREKKLFLQFVWARTRLPLKASDFDAPFKIVRDAKASAPGENGDEALPSASTCFFSLTLPEYSSKNILKDKLLFAIENVCTMESDYVTNDAEVGEGWKGI
jgi:hypothetical protein